MTPPDRRRYTWFPGRLRFDASTTPWSAWAKNGDSTYTLAWAGGCGLTGGCLSFSGTATGPGAVVSSNALSITAGKGYLLRFSARADSPLDLGAIVRHNASAWEPLGLSVKVAVTATRADHAFPFVATGTQTGRLDLTPAVETFSFLLDDVSLQEADVLENDPADDQRIFTNPTAVARTVELGSEALCDLTGAAVTGTVTLPPWSATVLVACMCNGDHACNNRETRESCPNDCP